MYADKSVSTVEVRVEGCANVFWKLTYSDNTIEQYYSFGGCPQVEGTDEYVSERMAEWLDYFSWVTIPIPGFDSDMDAVEYTVDLNTRYITITNIQRQSNDNKDEPQNIVLVLPLRK